MFTWLKGITFDQIKDEEFSHDGVYYDAKEWGRLVEAFTKLEVGDDFYNPYKNNWEPIKEIQIEWSNLTTQDNTVVGQYVNHVAVVLDSGYIIYDMYFTTEDRRVQGDPRLAAFIEKTGYQF